MFFKKIYLNQHSLSRNDEIAQQRKASNKTLKVQLCKLKKHWQMVAYMFQKYPEIFTYQLFIILQ